MNWTDAHDAISGNSEILDLPTLPSQSSAPPPPRRRQSGDHRQRISAALQQHCGVPSEMAEQALECAWNGDFRQTSGEKFITAMASIDSKRSTISLMKLAI
jgi:hypothetical protein